MNKDVILAIIVLIAMFVAGKGSVLGVDTTIEAIFFVACTFFLIIYGASLILENPIV